jgi:site-specific DNA-methyltransferase (adenine-specific)
MPAGRATDSGHNPNIGRWPANLIHDGSDEVTGLFPESNGQQGKVTGKEPSSKTNAIYGDFNGRPATNPREDFGSAARFFYCAKASDREIQAAEELPLFGESFDAVKNTHPTVKPLALMQWLIRLVTPPGGILLEPFAGSGTTLLAAKAEGRRAVGIEINEEYCEIAANRLRQGVLF